jgi:hypothetical protein
MKRDKSETEIAREQFVARHRRRPTAAELGGFILANPGIVPSPPASTSSPRPVETKVQREFARVFGRAPSPGEAEAWSRTVAGIVRGANDSRAVRGR